MEVEALDALLAAAREGSSASLLISGEPGIGKTTLLGHVAEVAAAEFTVLRTRGYESEQDLPYAGLYALLAPVVELRDRIPDVQAQALGTALALEAPAPHDPFAVPASVLSLLGAAAEERPVLAIVDDAHWLDAESLRAVLFAARRLEAEGIVLLLATREDFERGPAHPLDAAGLPRLALSRLDDAAARALLDEQAADVSAQVADQLVTIAGGNPLALRELPAALSAGQRTGSEPLPQALPVGSSMEQAFSDRIAALPDDARRALAVAAAMESGRLDLGASALRELGLGTAALDAAEAAGLLHVDGDLIAFRHPLLRSLAYRSARPSERRQAHTALAASHEDPTVRAWHLSAAAIGPDEVVAAALEEAAGVARGRGALDASAQAAERAAELSTDDPARLRRIAAAAADHAAAGRMDRALELVESAAELPAAEDRRVALELLRGRIQVRGGQTAEGRARLVAEAERIEASDPVGAAQLWLEIGVADVYSGNSFAQIEAADRAFALADGRDEHVAALAVLERATGLAPIGGAQESDRLLVQSAPLLTEGDPLPPYAELLAFAGQVATWYERYDLAEQVFNRQIAAARQASAIGVLSYPLAARAHLRWRQGKWTSALADAAEAERLARDTGQISQLSNALCALALIEAGRGDGEQAEAHGQEALGLVEGIGPTPFAIYVYAALGFAALTRERSEDAVEQLTRAMAVMTKLGGADPCILLFQGDLVEALARTGRRDEAHTEVKRLEGQAQSTGRPWAQAVAARGFGILAGEDEFRGHFERALEWHAKVDQPFEVARTRLAFGERLRRTGNRAESRGELEAASAAFERLGAGPWLQRADAELRSSGRTLRARGAPDDQLTPSELQVALRVADGLTNREVAGVLFLSVKTVEHHLSSIYRKLGVRSRTELARRIAADGTSAEAA